MKVWFSYMPGTIPSAEDGNIVGEGTHPEMIL